MFPAHAGMNRIRNNPEHMGHYVPRTRGDEPLPQEVLIYRY